MSCVNVENLIVMFQDVQIVVERFCKQNFNAETSTVCVSVYFITYKVDKRNNAARHLPLKSPVKNWMYKEIEDEQVTGVRIHCKKPWIEIYLNTCN